MRSLSLSLGSHYVRSANVLARRVVAIFPTGITTLIIGDDMPSSMATIPARIGSAAPAISTARAVKTTLNGRGAGRWSANAVEMGYRLAANQKTQVAVAQWTGAAMFPAFNGIVGGIDAYARLEGSAGTSNMLADPPGVYRDGISAVAVDSAPHIWESTSANTTAASRALGGLETSAVGNWQGLIAFCLQLSIQMSAQQRADLVAILKTYYSIP